MSPSPTISIQISILIKKIVPPLLLFSLQVNHARNIWDRAVTILPRANQFWYKYTYMEEMLGNVAGARNTFERWMEWEPEEQVAG